MRCRLLLFVFCLAWVGCDSATNPPDGGFADGRVCESPLVCSQMAEAATAAALESLRADPDPLRAFLVEMPKGGDLHNHLSGAIYAETYLDWARDDGFYCLERGGSNNLALSFSCDETDRSPIPDDGDALFFDVLRTWSMYEFMPTASWQGRDQFFSTFRKFGAISGRAHGRMLADVRRSAALENTLYLEPMLSSNSTARRLGEDVWEANHGSAALTESDLEAFHMQLLTSSGFDEARQFLIDDVLESENEANALMNCRGDTPEPGCQVMARFQVYISRSGTLTGVFAQMVAGYEAAMENSHIVGLNLVGPEDSSQAMAKYDDEMRMLGYLNRHYRDTGLSPLRLSLHAGEITEDSVPSSYAVDEVNHIRNAVEVAGAARIGHGVDIASERDPEGLFEMLRSDGVLVEICLASNDIILEVTGAEHPLRQYLDHGVPVSLATDDPGVARSSLTDEIVRAVVDQGLDYYELKAMARSSLEYSFIVGQSLWADFEMRVPVPECEPAAGETFASQPPSGACEALMSGSERARIERRLEVRLLEFEARH